jgi:hypothetical protein
VQRQQLGRKVFMSLSDTGASMVSLSITFMKRLRSLSILAMMCLLGPNPAFSQDHLGEIPSDVSELKQEISVRKKP